MTFIDTTKNNTSMLAAGRSNVVAPTSLRDLLDSGKFVRVLQVHDALSALVVDKTRIQDGTITRKFDGMWSSSLVDSAIRGKPDIECVDLSSRLSNLQEIFEVCEMPLIFDGDTGGKVEHFPFTVRALDRTGVSAVVIEDKVGLKRNSLYGTSVAQTQEDVEAFCEKIAIGKAAQRNREFMIFARCESLILDKGMDDAVARCKAYLSAGCDGILIHSRKEDPTEILEFASIYQKIAERKLLIVVPTAFSSVYENELEKAGVNIVIYANHLLRAAYPSMVQVAESILAHGRCHEALKDCMPIGRVLELIDGPIT